MNKRNENLTELQYYVTRESGTERPFTGPHLNEKSEGTFRCICCSTPLFASTHKYDSGSGWPSFYRPIKKEDLKFSDDYDLGYKRIEVKGDKSNSHLGHVFDDGPKESGLRYCINSASLKFIHKRDMKEEGYEYLLHFFD